MSELGRPARPNEIINLVQPKPAFVYDAINSLLASSKTGTIAKELVIEEIKKRLPDGVIFKYEWLDFELDYAKYGWSITYNSPCYYGGESFEPYFSFTKR